jgi:hypothetical protein
MRLGGPQSRSELCEGQKNFAPSEIQTPTVEPVARRYGLDAIEMGLSAMIYIPRFVKIGSGIQKLIGGDTHSLVIS